MDTTSELRRRRVFAGIAMIVAPLAAGIAFLIAPQMRSETADRIAEFAAAPGRIETALVIGLVAIALMVFAAISLGHLLFEEQPWLGQIGTVLAVIGLVLFAGTLGTTISVTQVAIVDTGGAVVLWDNVTSNPVTYVAIGGLVAAGVGFLLLAAGLVVARTAPMFSAAGLAIGVVVVAIGAMLASTTWAVIGFAVLFVGLAPLGYELIAEPDEAWEHPAHFEGMRPVLGGR